MNIERLIKHKSNSVILEKYYKDGRDNIVPFVTGPKEDNKAQRQYAVDLLIRGFKRDLENGRISDAFLQQLYEKN